MKTRRFRDYLEHKRQGKAILTKGEVANNPDPKIDEDFNGYPNPPSKEKLIKPKTNQEKKTAALDVKDGEKMADTSGKKGRDEQDSDGSGGAFGATEDVKE